MTAMTHFDTLQYVDTLIESGIPEKQAKALAKAQQEAFSQSIDTSLATKSDIFEVKTEINEIKSEIKETKAEIKLLRWMMTFIFTGIVTLILKSFF